ncbi:serine protease [Paenibacillus sp. GCM10012307]|uniref:Trypsin-like peptidase domain-containing protein n=1 Tax=Paenibacillus roseus TaxID=2798579 RepID=A0A934MR70_9BACL|nr:serine protease [Paenibacillus roseus]MBJ6362603.1 trypsin-like peptidase domain-containing protein [Paenibacillus roseus]
MSRRVKMMMLCLMALLISGMIAFTHASQASVPDSYNAKESYALARGAMLYLRVMGNGEAVKAVGSGVIISTDGTAVTAYHVVKGGERIEGVLSDGKVVGPITVTAYDELTDAAILQLPPTRVVKGKKETYPYLAMRESKLAYGEKVYALGYPMKDTPVITEGIVNNPNAEVNGRGRILTSAQIVSGMSGGPVLDEQGRLSGIVSGSMRTMPGIHLAIDMDAVRSLLQTASH